MVARVLETTVAINKLDENHYPIINQGVLIILVCWKNFPSCKHSGGLISFQSRSLVNEDTTRQVTVPPRSSNFARGSTWSPQLHN